MNRLNLMNVVLTCIVLIASCGGESPSDVSESTESGKLVTTSEQAILGGVTPVDERIAKALDGLELPQADDLPGLPSEAFPEHMASAAQISFLNGSDYYSDLKSSNAVVDGTYINLSAEANELSWAVYQFPIGEGSTLNKITVTASNGNFSGDDPGYWIGVADYSTGLWRAIALMNTTDSPYVRTLNLASSTYLSPNNNFYVFVLVQGQEVTINNLSVDYESVSWQHVEFGEGTNNAGWTPALNFVKGAGSLMIVYADYDSRKARYGIWEMSGDFSQASSWAFMDIDPLRADTPDVTNATCKWLDMTQDPITGYPRVSLVYDGASGGDYNTIIGLSVYVKGATALFLNYRLGNTTGMYINGAGYTSVDRNPVDGAYVVAHYVSNEGWAPPEDMHLRVFQINDPNNAGDDEPISVTKNFKTLFGVSCFNPHIRCLPNQNYAISVNGGYMYELTSDSYLDYCVDPNSNNLGSVADSGQAKGWGYCYVKQSDGTTTLRFVEDLENPSAQLHEVETAVSGSWIGASQLAYNPDGYPGIAYTKYNGSDVEIKLAEYDGSQWSIETVSTTPCTPTDTSDRGSVLVDLDYNIMGQPALIWNQLNGESCKAHVALRTE